MKMIIVEFQDINSLNSRRFRAGFFSDPHGEGCPPPTQHGMGLPRRGPQKIRPSQRIFQRKFRRPHPGLWPTPRGSALDPPPQRLKRGLVQGYLPGGPQKYISSQHGEAGLVSSMKCRNFNDGQIMPKFRFRSFF